MIAALKLPDNEAEFWCRRADSVRLVPLVSLKDQSARPINILTSTCNDVNSEF